MALVTSRVSEVIKTEPSVCVCVCVCQFVITLTAEWIDVQCIINHNKWSFGQKDCISGGMREVRDCSGVFMVDYDQAYLKGNRSEDEADEQQNTSGHLQASPNTFYSWC